MLQSITSDIDDRDLPFLTGERTSEGFFRSKAGMDHAIARGLAYAPYSDLVWCETSKPSLEEAKKFAEAIKKIIQKLCWHTTVTIIQLEEEP